MSYLLFRWKIVHQKYVTIIFECFNIEIKFLVLFTIMHTFMRSDRSLRNFPEFESIDWLLIINWITVKCVTTTVFELHTNKFPCIFVQPIDRHMCVHLFIFIAFYLGFDSSGIFFVDTQLQIVSSNLFVQYIFSHWTLLRSGIKDETVFRMHE